MLTDEPMLEARPLVVLSKSFSHLPKGAFFAALPAAPFAPAFFAPAAAAASAMTSALSGLDPAGTPFPFSFWMDLATVARNLLAWAPALALLCLPRARDTLRLTASPLVLKCSNSM